MAGYAKFDEEGAVITCNGPKTLIGRNVIADYYGSDGRVHREGLIVGVVFNGWSDHSVWAYEVTFADYIGPDGRPIVVDLRRGEFKLPKRVIRF